MSEAEHFMREALGEAEQAGAAGEFAIGAVVVIDGMVVSRGRARHQASRNQLMHAELQALQGAGERLWSEFERAVLFSTLEPCPMCLGASVMADVPSIIFALHDAVVGTLTAIQTVPYIRRHIRTYTGGVLEDEAREVIGRYNPRLLGYIVTGSFDLE